MAIDCASGSWMPVCLFGKDAHQARVPSRYMDMADSRNTPRCTHGRKVEPACDVCCLCEA